MIARLLKTVSCSLLLIALLVGCGGGGSTNSNQTPPPPVPTISSFSPSSGAVGVAITIIGTNLTGATSVVVAGESAAFTISSATQITTIVPAGAVTGKITVTTPGGTAISATNFTVNPPPPTIVSFSPTSGPTGASVSITGTGFTGATEVKFNGSSATFNITDDSHISASVPNSATSGTISVTTPSGTGTSSTSFTVSASIQATPTFSPVAGRYTSTQTVTLASSGADNIYYTLDGSTPDTSSSVYSKPLPVQTSETIKAMAVKATKASAVGTAAYVISAVNTNGLIAEYQMLPSESPAALVDYSGSGNDATGTAGTAPTTIPISGGVSFPGTGAIHLPAALNAAKSMMFFMTYSQNDSDGLFPTLIGGNGATFTGVIMQYPTQYNNQVDTWATRPGAQTMGIFNGPGVFSFVMDTTNPYYFNNNVFATVIKGVSSADVQVDGNYQLGGVSGKYRNYAKVKIYYAIFYNRVLSSAEVAANVTAMAASMADRGVSGNVGFTSADTGNNFLMDGDSIARLLGYGYQGIIDPSFTKWGTGVMGATVSSLDTNYTTRTGVMYRRNASRNCLFIWAGTNDIFFNGTGSAAYASLVDYATKAKTQGWKVIVSTMMTRTGVSDTEKDALNTLIRTNWQSFCDGVFDPASHPNLGAVGASTDTEWFGDGTHPTNQTLYNIALPLSQRAINRVYGRLSYATGRTYTASAAAPTPITGSSQAGNTMTFICILNPAVGSTVTVSGVTPSGYNGRWYVLTSSPTSFTAWNMNTGLGVGTVFGTAAVPMMQDDDVFINLGGSAVSPNFTLQTAIGMVNQSCYIKNTSATSTWTLVPDNSETINGSAGFTLGPGAEVSIQSQLVSTSGAGANWITLGTEAIPTFSPAADSYSGPQSVPELP